VGKNLTFGGIINDVQLGIAKNGKGWGLEGYDKAMSLRSLEEP
jgi:DNA polymerase-3 subunit alpha